MPENDYEKFLQEQAELATAAASMANGLDMIKRDLVGKGWNESQAEATATVMFNTLLMTVGLNR